MYECICQLDYEYHAWCLISALFLRNLYIFFQLHKCQVSEGSTRLMLLLFIIWSPATLQASCILAAKDCYLSTLLSAHVWSILEYKMIDLQTKEAWASRAGWKAIRLCRSTEKALGHICSCGTCRSGTCVLHEPIQMYACVTSKLDCPVSMFCLRHTPSTFDSSMLQRTAFLESLSCWLPL